MKKNNLGFSFIYVLLIIMLVSSLGLIVVNKQAFFQSSFEYDILKTKIQKNINAKYNTYINFHKKNNSDGGLFLNTIKCPSLVNYLTFTGSTSLYFDYYKDIPSYICSGSLNNENLNLYFSGNNALYNTFSQGKLGSNLFNLNINNGTATGIINGNNLTFSFSGTDFSSIDLDKNSDNYKVTSTGNIYYPNGDIDNDVIARQLLFGYAGKGSYSNIFWNNKKINDFIDSNLNNTDNINKKVSQVSSGIINLDVDGDFDLKIIEFDKNIFNSQNRLVKLKETNISKIGGIAGLYLQNDNSFSLNKVSPKIFDFKNKDYGFFIKAGSGSVIGNVKYKFYIEDISGSGVYINPIKDDKIPMEFLSSNVILYNSGFIWNMDKITDN